MVALQTVFEEGILEQAVSFWILLIFFYNMSNCDYIKYLDNPVSTAAMLISRAHVSLAVSTLKFITQSLN